MDRWKTLSIFFVNDREKLSQNLLNLETDYIRTRLERVGSAKSFLRMESTTIEIEKKKKKS